MLQTKVTRDVPLESGQVTSVQDEVNFCPLIQKSQAFDM
jgi:hypothetical protein